MLSRGWAEGVREQRRFGQRGGQETVVTPKVSRENFGAYSAG